MLFRSFQPERFRELDEFVRPPAVSSAGDILIADSGSDESFDGGPYAVNLSTPPTATSFRLAYFGFSNNDPVVFVRDNSTGNVFQQASDAAAVSTSSSSDIWTYFDDGTDPSTGVEELGSPESPGQHHLSLLLYP